MYAYKMPLKKPYHARATNQRGDAFAGHYNIVLSIIIPNKCFNKAVSKSIVSLCL